MIRNIPKIFLIRELLILFAYSAVYLFVLFNSYASPLQIFSDSDVADYFYPHIVNSFRSYEASGGLTSFVYSPNSQAGYFSDTSGQLQTYYPIKYLIALVSSNILVFEILYYAVHVFIAYLGMKFWLMHHNISKINAVVSSILYVTSPLFITWQSLYHSLAFFAFAPLIFLQIEKLISNSGQYFKNSAYLITYASLLTSGSHLQNVYILFVFLVVFILASLIRATERIRILVYLFTNAVIIGIVTIPVWNSFVHQMKSSIRGAVEVEVQNNFAFNVLLTYMSEFWSNGKITNINILFLPTPLAVLFIIGYFSSKQDVSTFICRYSVGIRYLLACVFMSICASRTYLGEVLGQLIPLWGYQSNTQRISFVILPTILLFLAHSLEIAKDTSYKRSALVLLASFSLMVFMWYQSYGIFIASLFFISGIYFFSKLIYFFSKNAALTLLMLSIIAMPVSNVVLTFKSNTKAVQNYYKLTNTIDQLDDGGLWVGLCQPIEPFKYKTSANLLSSARFLDSYDSFVSRSYFTKMGEVTGETFSDTPSGGQWYQGTSREIKAKARILKDNFVTRVIVGKNCASNLLKPLYMKLAEVDGYSIFGLADYSGYYKLPDHLGEFKSILGNYVFRYEGLVVLAMKYDNRIQFRDSVGRRILTKPFQSFFTTINEQDLDSIREINFVPLSISLKEAIHLASPS